MYGFDGFQVDQVGDRGAGLYNYNGITLELASRFLPFLEGKIAAHPSKRLVMYAVNQFGQQNRIGSAPVDFMYTEVWTGHEGYKDLAAVIQNNVAFSGGKSTLLAAYVNYNKAGNRICCQDPRGVDSKCGDLCFWRQPSRAG